MAQSQDVYTFSDLQQWETIRDGISPPAKLAVFGDPIAHSRSPQLQNPALMSAGIDAQYVRFHITPEEFEEAISLLKSNGFIGVNVTIPHKESAFRVVDDMTEVARRIGMVNTILMEDDQLIGHNTDAPGLHRAIREAFSIDPSDLRIMIIGAGGGAGRAAAVQCAMDQCERLVLVNRTAEKVEQLATELEEVFSQADRLEGPADRLTAIPWDESAMARELENVDLIINATSVGMKRSDPAVVPARLLQPHHLIYDMIYAPARTRLMADAEGAGARASNGLGMLLWQGALAFEFWFNQEAPVEEMRLGLSEG